MAFHARIFIGSKINAVKNIEIVDAHCIILVARYHVMEAAVAILGVRAQTQDFTLGLHSLHQLVGANV